MPERLKTKIHASRATRAKQRTEARKTHQRTKTDRQALLAAVVDYCMGEDDRLPPTLMERLLAVNAPWLVLRSRVARVLSPASCSQLHAHWRRYFTSMRGMLRCEDVTLQTASIELTFTSTPVVSPTTGLPPKTFSTVDGSLEDVLFFQIATLVHHVGFANLLECECGRLFVKIGRRTRCSTRCVKRLYMKAKRVRERAQELRFKGGSANGQSTRTR